MSTTSPTVTLPSTPTSPDKYRFSVIPKKEVKTIRVLRERARENGKEIQVDAYVRTVGDPIPAIHRYADLLRKVESAARLCSLHSLNRSAQAREWAQRAIDALTPLTQSP